MKAKNSNKLRNIILLFSIILIFCSKLGLASLYDYYSFTGYNELGEPIYGELTGLGFDGKTVQGYIYKKNNKQIYFKGWWVKRGKVKGYDDNGLFIKLKTHKIGIGKNYSEIQINACQYLIDYLNEALISNITNYVGFTGKISLMLDRVRAFMGDVKAKRSLYTYKSLILEMPSVATNFRIIYANPDRNHSEKRVKEMMGLDYPANSAKKIIQFNIRFLHNSVCNYKNVSINKF